MEFFVYCRDRPATGDLRAELVEAHWAYMDGFADVLVARGPTLTEDREEATGSLHVVDLPDADAARAFAHDEPNFRAGVYAEVEVRRWRNDLGTTMWDVPPTGEPGFLFTTTDLVTPDALGGRAILCGTLLADDGVTEVGTAGLLGAPDRETVEMLLPGARILPWERGGRR